MIFDFGLGTFLLFLPLKCNIPPMCLKGKLPYLRTKSLFLNICSLLSEGAPQIQQGFLDMELIQLR